MKPIIVNNSKVPAILSALSPIDIWAVTIWPFIFCRGELSVKTENHESIHIEQYNDLFVVGFLLIYYFDYIRGYIKYRDGNKAYYRIRAEQEAYENQSNSAYLSVRNRYEWLRKYKV